MSTETIAPTATLEATAPKKKPMRELMPQTAAFVDAMRKAFGDKDINDALRDGGLYAEENGHVVGTPPSENIREYRYER